MWLIHSFHTFLNNKYYNVLDCAWNFLKIDILKFSWNHCFVELPTTLVQSSYLYVVFNYHSTNNLWPLFLKGDVSNTYETYSFVSCVTDMEKQIRLIPICKNEFKERLDLVTMRIIWIISYPGRCSAGSVLPHGDKVPL